MPHNSQWMVVTFKKPVMWTRNEDETWILNPNRRYVLNANQLGNLSEYIAKMSDLKAGEFYKPLQAGQAHLEGSTVLIERFRERGIGDLLFLTGPMNYMRYVSANGVGIDCYALADRGVIMANHPALRFKATLAGPLHYDDLQNYDYQWFVDTATEYVEEHDQLNVYDALYKSLGFDPGTIPAQFKRPTAHLDDQDAKNRDQFFHFTFLEKKIDLRKTGYYVIAPFARGSLRVARYQMWLEVINELKKTRPVVVIGSLDGRIPATDMTAGEFNQQINQAGSNVINVLKSPAWPVRVMMSIISGAIGVGTLDTGPLYVAQALRIPAVSVWGPHDPGVRIGYDQPYMDLAVWEQAECRHCPCYAYDGFPADQCPQGEQQLVCQPLASTPSSAVLEKFAKIEAANAGSRV
jgi:hypothetical protein